MNELHDTFVHKRRVTEHPGRVVSVETDQGKNSVENPQTENPQTDSSRLSETEGRMVHRDASVAMFNIEEFIPLPAAIKLISEKTARHYGALPIAYEPSSAQLLVAMSQDSNVLARDRIQRETGHEISVQFVTIEQADLDRLLDLCYGVHHSIDLVLQELDSMVNTEGTLDNAIQPPVERLVDALLSDAVQNRCTDIHLSPDTTVVRVRHRIDGVLSEVCCFRARYWSAVLVRIKVLFGMDIAETRLPQDGHVSRLVNGHSVDFRASSFPTRSGENLVLRVLDRRQGLKPLSTLCVLPVVETALKNMIDRPDGLVVVCGPTGSGKTTTLYALLETLDATSLNIMTLEDPVEYPMEHIQQSRVQSTGSIDFASGVRGIMRQDPDVILVGEVRDADSCAMTCRAAVTGHLVLTSTHADDCFGAIVRLLDLGAEAKTLAHVLQGVLAQRLARRICFACHANSSDCLICAGSGYHGRVAVIEFLVLSDALRSALMAGCNIDELRRLAHSEGMTSLKDRAEELLAAGFTTKSEINRVLS